MEQLSLLKQFKTGEAVDSVLEGSGKLFQIQGAATEKRWLPRSLQFLHFGMCSSSAESECRLRDGLYGRNDKDRYGGCSCLEAL